MIAAASDVIWNNGGACGRMYRVRCTGATNEGVPQPCRGDGNGVVVKIVDYCPPGCRGTIDLSEELFSTIANPDAAIIKIEYTLLTSSCYGYQDNGVMIAAASDAIWNNRRACGRMYRVRCTGATNQGVPQPCRGDGNGVVVKIVDYCPPPGCHVLEILLEAYFSLTVSYKWLN
nr:EG45-like domain containing protein [Ziziphus jujuba var. spinosa]